MRNVAGVALLLTTLVAGCLGGSTSAGEHFDGLGTGSAEVTDQGDLRILAWRGELGPGATAPLVGAARGSDEQTFAFDVDGRVGYAAIRVTGDGAVTAAIRDDQDRIACGTVGGPDGGPTCTAPVPAGAPQRTYEVVVAPGENSQATPFQVIVELHPRDHIQVGRVSGLDDATTFHIGDTGALGGEPTVGVTSDGSIFVVVGTTVLRSDNDGHTWQDVTPPFAPASLDPMLYVDPYADRVFVDHLYVACSYLSWSDDKGESWITNPAACGDSAIDHQKLAVGGTPLPIAPYDGTVYFTFNSFTLLVDGAAHIVASRSLDGGINWVPTVALTEGDLGAYRTGGPVVADRDGTVHIPFYLCDGGFGVTTSTDYGVTWNPVRAGEASGGCQAIDPGVAIDAAGNAYGAYWGPEGIQVVRSSDDGATWAPANGAAGRVSADGLRSFVLVDAIAGDEGRVAVAYLATADGEGRGPNYVPGWSTWHLYVSTSLDAAAEFPTWTTARVTPRDDPVQVGTICTGGIGCAGGNRNLLDFIDVQLTPDGRVVVAYTDGCTTDCHTERVPQASRDERGMVAVQTTGPRLFVDAAPWA